MSVSSTEPTSGSGSVVSSAGKTRLSGSRLIIARAVWLALVIPGLGLFVASLPGFYALLQRACVDPVTCNVAGTLTAKGLQELPALGLSVSGYAALLTIFFTIIVAIWSGIGLQTIVRAVTGAAGQQPLVIAGSTLVIAALFQPLRR